jgi:methylmalonyl-CoA mutase
MSVNWSDEFPFPSTEQWVEEIKKSVKDPKDLEKLIWTTENGFDLNAFYRKSDSETTGSSNLSSSNNHWDIRQIIYTDKIIAANQSAILALENGADSLYFRANQVGTEKEVEALLKDIRLDWISTHFDFEESNVAWIYLYLDYLNTHQFDPQKIKGSINYDPLSELMMTGNFHYDEKESERIFSSVLQTIHEELPLFKIVNINASNVRESGGSAVQELAVALSMLVEYLDWAEKNKLDQSLIWDHLQFHLSISPEYFLEISKLRAFKIMFKHLAAAYGRENETPFIHAINSRSNKTIYDANNNLIRSTTEAMSAAIGGASSISIVPFDETYRLPDEFSYRLSRNIQLILKEEAFMDEVTDPSAGSYYIEQITQKMVDASWKLFLEMEKNGGFIASLKNKFIQQKVQVIAEKHNNDFMSGKIVSVGTNKYPNKTEVKTGEYTKVEHTDISNENKIAIPLKPIRLAEKLEFERIKQESNSTVTKN